MDEEWSPSPNFGSREGKSILAIVNHTSSGLFPGCLEWLQNPAAKVSSHYLITKTGRIIQLVKEGNAAYHAGIVNKPDWKLYDGTNPNKYTIGIEHEGFSGEPLTDPQYQASLFLHKELTTKYGMPIDTDHIIGHYRIDSVNRPDCPGLAFPWTELFSDLKGGGNMSEATTTGKTIASNDIYLSVRVREPLADQAILDINKLGFAAKKMDLA